MKLVIAMGRCSKGDLVQANSLTYQERTVLDYMDASDMVAIPETCLNDNGVSAYQLATAQFADRPAGAKAIRMLEHGVSVEVVAARLPEYPLAEGQTVVTVNDLIFATTDRWTRNKKAAHDFLEWLEEHGKQIHFARMRMAFPPRGESNAQNTLNSMNLELYIYMAQLEGDMMSDRVNQTFKLYRSKDLLCGSPAYGQRGVPSGEWRTKRKGNQELHYELLRAEVDLVELAWLEQILQWYHLAGWTRYRIAAELNARGVPNKSGGRWGDSGVGHVLTSKFAAEVAVRLGLDPGGARNGEHGIQAQLVA